MNLEQLREIARELRVDVIKMLAEAGSGHPASALGLADIFAVLYFEALNLKPESPNWSNRDRLLLSNGHACPILYAALARRGFFPKKKLRPLRQIDSILQGHPSRVDTPGVEISAGPLGQGISQAVGMALAARLDKKKYRVYCVMSDGELNEGQSWEAFMTAAKFKLANLTIIIDRNNIQIDGSTDQIMPLEPLRQKLETFNLTTIEIDGNNLYEIRDSLQQSLTSKVGPTVIIAKTVPGKGVSFMEGKYAWHGKAPNFTEALAAIKELTSTK